MDQLSSVFDLVEVRGVLSGGFAVEGPWVSTARIEGLKFCVVVAGGLRLATDGIDAPVELGAGDVAILKDRTRLEMRGGSGEGAVREVQPEKDFASIRRLDHAALNSGEVDVVIGGHVDLAPVGRLLLARALPPLAHIRAGSVASSHLHGSIHRLLEEVTSDRVGAAYAIRQHTQLLLLEALRAYADQPELPSGWLRALSDPQLRPAFDAIHAAPARAWTLADLAGAATMSRTAFITRFRDVAGMPPISYLNHWRMVLAQRALRDRDTRVGELASQLGYGSEAAFSTAFKRETGLPPLRYRQRVRQPQPSQSKGAAG